jgi:hypothetical protein
MENVETYIFIITAVLFGLYIVIGAMLYMERNSTEGER